MALLEKISEGRRGDMDSSISYARRGVQIRMYVLCGGADEGEESIYVLYTARVSVNGTLGLLI
jgi:hypothetical protein